VLIEVADDGVGMGNRPASALRRTGAGIGMKNVQERLEVLYGNQARFSVVSNPGRGTLVSIEIPGCILKKQKMVRFTVLASGSKGNCTVVSGGRTRILVDAGLSCRELFRRMKLAGEEPETLDAIVITHEHSDHVNGLAVTARKLGIPVYFTEGTHRAWMRWLTPRRQMTYAQWLEQCRKQAAERQAEADAAAEGEPDESDLVEAG
jgi:hypothetical protein